MKRRSFARFGLVVAAAVILSNPSPMYFDILPDALGFFFLWLAFRRLAELVPAFDDVREAGNKLLLITTLRIPAWFAMMTIWGGDASQRALIAVCCFVSAILELCYLIPWIHRLFEAFYRLGEQYGCTSAITVTGSRFRMAPEKLEVLTVVFFSVRAVLSCLPEMTLVPVYDSAEEYLWNWNRMYIPCAVIAAVVLLIFAAVWLCYFIAYVRRVGRDVEGCEELRTLDATAPCRYRQPPALLRCVSFLYLAGIVLSIDIYADRMNLLPDILSALAFAGCGFYLRRLRGRGRAVWILPLVWGGVTLAHTALWTRFFRVYSIGAIERLEAAARDYRVILMVSALSEALFLATAIVLFAALLGVTRDFTGKPAADGRLLRADVETRRSLTRSLTVSLVFACLTAGLSFFYELSLSETVDIVTDYSYLSVPRFEWAQLVLWVATAAWLVASLRYFGRLREETEPVD